VPGMRYEPGLLVPASCWLARRELMEDLGGWRFYKECHSVPSQDLLYRAWKAGKDLRLVPQLTLVAIYSGSRQRVYAKREAWENQLYFDRIRHEPDFRTRELTSIVTNYETPWHRWYPAHQLILRALRNASVKICVAAGLDPIAVRNFFIFFRKGAFIDRLRRRRGLEPLGRSRREVAGAGFRKEEK